MITIIAKWETSQMPSQIEWQLWRQLRGAFKITRFIFVPIIEEMAIHHVDQVDTMEEALDMAKGERVFLEPTGYKGMHELPQGDIVLILGNTETSNMKYAQVNETYKIMTPQRTVLYGTDAAAIALAIRYGQ